MGKSQISSVISGERKGRERPRLMKEVKKTVMHVWKILIGPEAVCNCLNSKLQLQYANCQRPQGYCSASMSALSSHSRFL
jgi:hypothetical protein